MVNMHTNIRDSHILSWDVPVCPSRLGLGLRMLLCSGTSQVIPGQSMAILDITRIPITADEMCVVLFVFILLVVDFTSVF